VFEDPDSYRVDRDPREHIAFGYSAHMCIGAPLARMEGVAVLRELVERVSAIEASAATTWSTNSTLRGPVRLPVTLRPTAGASTRDAAVSM
jgi:cytochrome P450